MPRHRPTALADWQTRCSDLATLGEPDLPVAQVTSAPVQKVPLTHINSLLSLRVSESRRPQHLASGPAVTSAAFEALMDRDAGSIARPNNRITLHLGGPAIKAARAELFKRAQPHHHLYGQTFVHRDDADGREWSQGFRDHAARGGMSRVSYDGRGSEETNPPSSKKRAEPAWTCWSCQRTCA